MKKILFILVWVCFSITSGFGQCEVFLKKQGKYDWVADFNYLKKIYGSKEHSEKVSSLSKYFYDDNRKPKECITFGSLKLLKNDLEIVFKDTKKLDGRVSQLSDAIKTILSKNPTVEGKKPISQTLYDSIPKLEEPLNEELKKENDALKEKAQILTDGNQTIKDDKEGSLKLSWFSILSLLVGIAGITLYLFEKRKFSKAIEKKEKQFQKDLAFNGEFSREKIEKLDRQNKELTFENNALRQQYEQSKKRITENQVEIKKAEYVELEKKTEVMKQFYLTNPTPTDDGLGSFRDIRQNQENPTNSFYRFALEKDENKAQFWFLNNLNTIQSAIHYPETYINPACNYTGFNSKATKINTKMPGMAVKKGDIWMVQIKAEIQFE